MTESERTAELVQEAKEFLGLARLATRGPWGWGSQKKNSYDELMEGRFLYAHRSVDYDGGEREANGDFITAAREFADTTLPALLKRLAAPAATSISGGAGEDLAGLQPLGKTMIPNAQTMAIIAKAGAARYPNWKESDFESASLNGFTKGCLATLRAITDTAKENTQRRAASPASVTSPQDTDFGRFSNDLDKRLPDAFTNAIGVLEHLGREGVAEHLQRVAKIWQRDLKTRATELAELKQELGNLYATIFRDGGHMQAALDADTPPEVPTLDRPRYVEAIKAYWKLRQQAESPAALDINKAADWLLDHGRILFDDIHDGEDAKKVAAFAFAESLIENCAAALTSPLGVDRPGGAGVQAGEAACYTSAELTDISSIITWLHAQNRPMGELVRRFYRDATRGKLIHAVNALNPAPSDGK